MFHICPGPMVFLLCLISIHFQFLSYIISSICCQSNLFLQRTCMLWFSFSSILFNSFDTNTNIGSSRARMSVYTFQIHRSNTLRCLLHFLTGSEAWAPLPLGCLIRVPCTKKKNTSVWHMQGIIRKHFHIWGFITGGEQNFYFCMTRIWWLRVVCSCCLSRLCND